MSMKLKFPLLTMILLPKIDVDKSKPFKKTKEIVPGEM